MAEQTEFSCVSCETTFDPSPNGGFCPDCNTPHPDYEAPSDDDADSSDDDSEPVDNAEDDVEVEYDEEDEAETDADDEDEAEAETDADGDDTEDDADEPATVECQSCDSSVDASAAFCPNCGEELEEADESEADDPVELTECPDCGNSVDEESFCPGCGTDLDAIRESGDVDEAGDEEPADEAGDDETSDEDVADDDTGDDEAADDEASDDEGTDDDASDEVPTEVTLEIDGEPYTFGDGDVFGRRDEEWLADLVSASGGREEARYLSSEHLEFSVEDDGIYMTDVSTNGTKLNGTAMDGSEEKLEDGDTLELAGRAEIDVTLS